MINKAILCIVIFTCFGCHTKESFRSFDGSVTDSLTTVAFYVSNYNIGTVNKGDTTYVTFKFKNTGKNSLYITSLNMSCGCMYPDFPKKPVQPAMEDSIVVRFLSLNQIGRQFKTIQVHTNTNEEISKLTIEGIVK